MLRIGESHHNVTLSPSTRDIGVVLQMEMDGREVEYVVDEAEWRAMDAYASAEFLRQRILRAEQCES